MRRQISVSRVLLALVATTFFMTSTAWSHEFIVQPDSFHINHSKEVGVNVLSAHVYMKSEEVEPVENVEVGVVSGDKKQIIPLKENPDLKVLQGQLTLAGEGTVIIYGHRKGMVWCQTTGGWKQASKKDLEGVIKSGKYEKFSKAIVTNGRSDDQYRQVLGHDLEIVPVSNPGVAAVGDEIELQVMYKGKPLATRVFATYDGFSDRENTYAYVTEANSNGEAAVKVTAPGTWMARVEYTENEATADYDAHVIRAVLLFSVKG